MESIVGRRNCRWIKNLYLKYYKILGASCWYKNRIRVDITIIVYIEFLEQEEYFDFFSFVLIFISESYSLKWRHVGKKCGFKQIKY